MAIETNDTTQPDIEKNQKASQMPCVIVGLTDPSNIKGEEILATMMKNLSEDDLERLFDRFINKYCRRRRPPSDYPAC